MKNKQWPQCWQKIDNQYAVSRCGQVKDYLKDRILGQWKNDQGYMLVRLNNPRRVARVHRLIASAFCLNPFGYPYVNHIDCVRSNNNADNLEWCTQWQNLNHSRKLGRMQEKYWKGKRSPNASLTDVQVEEIKNKYADGNISWEKLGKEYGVSKRTIGRILNEETYL